MPCSLSGNTRTLARKEELGLDEKAGGAIETANSTVGAEATGSDFEKHCHHSGKQARNNGGGKNTHTSQEKRRQRDLSRAVCCVFALLILLTLHVFGYRAKTEGYFLATVHCSGYAASEQLNELGFWVGWQYVHSNFGDGRLIELSLMSQGTGQMGRAVGKIHVAACILNIATIFALLWVIVAVKVERLGLRLGRWQKWLPHAFKVLCLGSLVTGVVLALALTGFHISMTRGFSSDMRTYYEETFMLTCADNVAVIVDFAYVMTVMTIMCHLIVGVIALSLPPRLPIYEGCSFAQRLCFWGWASIDRDWLFWGAFDDGSERAREGEEADADANSGEAHDTTASSSSSNNGDDDGGGSGDEEGGGEVRTASICHTMAAMSCSMQQREFNEQHQVSVVVHDVEQQTHPPQQVDAFHGKGAS